MLLTFTESQPPQHNSVSSLMCCKSEQEALQDDVCNEQTTEHPSCTLLQKNLAHISFRQRSWYLPAERLAPSSQLSSCAVRHVSQYLTAVNCKHTLLRGSYTCYQRGFNFANTVQT
eukprot:6367326-Amphidinium_carterae.1